jgi:hypothetical protein
VYRALLPTVLRQPCRVACLPTPSLTPAFHLLLCLQAYVPQIAGLPGGDGHAGWLISGSRGLLNLWWVPCLASLCRPALPCAVAARCVSCNPKPVAIICMGMGGAAGAPVSSECVARGCVWES